jgi:hypothetical protein
MLVDIMEKRRNKVLVSIPQDYAEVQLGIPCSMPDTWQAYKDQ